jgi:hypothetical protein
MHQLPESQSLRWTGKAQIHMIKNKYIYAGLKPSPFFFSDLLGLTSDCKKTKPIASYRVLQSLGIGNCNDHNISRNCGPEVNDRVIGTAIIKSDPHKMKSESLSQSIKSRILLKRHNSFTFNVLLE